MKANLANPIAALVASFIEGRDAIAAFLARTWQHELDYRLVKELWAHADARIAVRFAYEWHNETGNWFRSFGNENWEFDAQGYIQRRIVSINDLAIHENDRRMFWKGGARPLDYSGLSDLGL